MRAADAMPYLLVTVTETPQIEPDQGGYKLQGEQFQLDFLGPVELVQLVTNWVQFLGIRSKKRISSGMTT